jgi:double-stranded uracil-DNA glycosylase
LTSLPKNVSRSQTFQDYLQPRLDVVFCGTAAGNESAARGYFGGPGNQFWPILHRTGLTAQLLRPDECHRVCEFGIGLTDLVKHHFGNDATLTREMFDVPGFEDKIRAHAPRFVAFNGKEGLTQLLQRPGGTWMGSDVAMDQAGRPPD